MTEPKKHLPAWRYKYGQTPKVVETEPELKAAAAEGWVDSPDKAVAVIEAAKALPPQPPPLEPADTPAVHGPEPIDWSARRFTDPEPGAPVPIPVPEAPKRKRKR